LTMIIPDQSLLPNFVASHFQLFELRNFASNSFVTDGQTF